MKKVSMGGAALAAVIFAMNSQPLSANTPPAVDAQTQSTQSAPARSHYVTIVDIPMRDGTLLRGNLLTPGHGKPVTVIVSATPYGRHAMYPLAKAYVAAGFGFLAVDVRGRGDSEGSFAMFYGDKQDTVDLIDWTRQQPFSSGQVAMWGASYGGYNQWMAAAKQAPGLATITPAAAVYPGHDFPMVLNTGYPYASIWTGFTKGRNANFPLFNDRKYWREAFADLLRQGVPFSETDRFVGFDTDLFDEWVAHPFVDEYWKGINPSDAEMAAIDMPILSITGVYDGAQIGALRYYNQHMANASPEARAKHYLIIGPYDHSGVNFPAETVGGLGVPNRGQLDPLRLFGEWYGWHLAGTPRPEFLRDRVMYYVMGEGANEWRSAPSLDAIPVDETVFSLTSASASPTSVTATGSLTERSARSTMITYRFDPTDLSKASLGVWYDGDFAIHSADIDAIDGEAFIFETAAFDLPTEIIGRPRFTANIGISTPDTDFQARIYEILPDGSSIFLGETRGRARHRESVEREVLIENDRRLPYSFSEFSFISRRLQQGSKLRFVFGAPNSIYIQRNYNAAKPVAEHTPDDALTVEVSMRLGGRDGAQLVIPMRKFAVSSKEGSVQ